MIWIRFAWSNILANGRRSAIVCGAIAFAVVALLLYGNYVNGVRIGLRYGTIRSGVGHLQIAGVGGFDTPSETPLANGLSRKQFEALSLTAERLDSVRVVAPRLTLGGLISSGARTVSFSGAGVDPDAESAAFSQPKLVDGERLSADSPDDAVVLGDDLARQLGVKVGDTVTALTATVSGALNAVDWVVVGTIDTGVPQNDLYYARVKLSAAQSLLATDRLSLASVLLRDESDIPAVAARLGQASPGLETRDWLRLSPFFSQIVGMYERQFRVLGGLMLIVTLMGVATMIVTSVLERTREIGVMRSLGVSSSRVRLSFVLEGLMLSGIGLAFGAGLGAAGSRLVNALQLSAPPPPGRSTGPPLILVWDWSALGQIAGVMLVLCLLTSWLASGRVASLRVADALRAA